MRSIFKMSCIFHIRTLTSSLIINWIKVQKHFSVIIQKIKRFDMFIAMCHLLSVLKMSDVASVWNSNLFQTNYECFDNIPEVLMYYSRNFHYLFHYIGKKDTLKLITFWSFLYIVVRLFYTTAHVLIVMLVWPPRKKVTFKRCGINSDSITTLYLILWAIGTYKIKTFMILWLNIEYFEKSWFLQHVYFQISFILAIL